MPHQLFGVFSVVRKDRDADADGDENLLSVQKERAGGGLDDLGGHRLGIGPLVHFRQHDDKLVPSEPRDAILFPHRGLDALRHLPKKSVAAGVAERVVDPLEVIDIDEQSRHSGAASSRIQGGAGQPVERERAVGELGERIIVRLHHQAVLVALAQCDIDNGRL